MTSELWFKKTPTTKKYQTLIDQPVLVIKTQNNNFKQKTSP